MKSNTILVAAAVIIHQNKIFIAKRNTFAKNFGKWEFPGGKIENQEIERDALKREIQEELGWGIQVGKHFLKTITPMDEKNIVLSIYLAKLLSTNLEPTLNAHSAYRWATQEELTLYDFAEADKPAVAKLQLLHLETLYDGC